MARYTQSQAFQPSNTDDGSAQFHSNAAKAFGAFGDRFLKEHAENRIKDAEFDAQQADFKNPTLKDNNTIYGNTFDEIVLKGHQADVRMSMTNKLNELMVANEDNPLAFKASADEIRKEMMKEVHPNVKGATEIYFNSQIEQGFGKLRTNQMIVEKGVAEGKMNQEIQDLAAKANRDAREGADDSINASNLNAISAAIYNAPHLNENQKETALRSAIIGVVNNVHLSDINAKGTSEAKYAYLDGIKDAVPETHTVEEWDNFVAQARARIARDDAIEKGKVAAEGISHRTNLTNMVGAIQLGFEYSDDELQNIRNKSTPEQNRVLDDAVEGRAISLLPLPEQLEIAADLKERGNIDDVNKYKQTINTYSALRAKSEADAIGTLISQGLSSQVNLPTTPEEINARAGDRVNAAKQYGLRLEQVNFFSASELEKVKPYLDNLTYSEQVAYVQTLHDQPAALEQLQDKGNATLVIASGLPLSAQVLMQEGASALRSGLAKMPTNDEANAVLREASGLIYHDDAFVAVRDAVNTLYAGRKLEKFDRSAWLEDLKTISGGYGSRNGGKFELPRDENKNPVTASKFNNWLNRFNEDTVEAIGGVASRSSKEGARLIRDSQPISVKGGKYAFYHAGLKLRLLAPDGEELVIAYNPSLPHYKMVNAFISRREKQKARQEKLNK